MLDICDSTNIKFSILHVSILNCTPFMKARAEGDFVEILEEKNLSKKKLKKFFLYFKSPSFFSELPLNEFIEQKMIYILLFHFSYRKVNYNFI